MHVCFLTNCLRFARSPTKNHSSGKGTTYVYDSFFRPYVAKYATKIDCNLLELRTRARDIAVLYWQRAFSYRIYDILQFVAAQSTPASRPA
ncbi:hypothetical protein JHK87_028008 [Glycine soja]|nr:hypothetical protein JHK87_028008 [Glycine soja]